MVHVLNALSCPTVRLTGNGEFVSMIEVL